MSKRKSKEIAIHRFLVLCEGESERIYIEEYKKGQAPFERIYRIEVKVFQPEDYSPWGLVKEAKERVEGAKRDGLPYESVWVVFDKDKHTKIPDAFNEANNHKPKINIAFSVICFEYWILLHFEKTTKLFLNCNEIIKYIKQKKYIPDYDKVNFFPRIQNKIPFAISNGKWCIKQCKCLIDRDPRLHKLSVYTNFHLLLKSVDEFLIKHYKRT